MDNRDIIKRLEITAGMIEMCEGIEWGSDSSVMRDASVEISRLRKALEFYADPENWRDGGFKSGSENGQQTLDWTPCTVVLDSGNRARVTLSAAKEQTETKA